MVSNRVSLTARRASSTAPECLTCAWGSGFAKRDLKVSIVGANHVLKIGIKDDDEARWLSARARGPMLNNDAKSAAYIIRK